MVVFTSNYTLYGDMSRRMNTVYERFASDIEVYSIDESFLDMTAGGTGASRRTGRDLRSDGLDLDGGADLRRHRPDEDAGEAGQQDRQEHPAARGDCDLTSEEARREWLPLVPIEEDIWASAAPARPSSPPLDAGRPQTVASLDPKLARQTLTVVGERIIHECAARPWSST